MYNDQKTNKHGLPRNIPSDVQRKIRQDDGYGCVICGQILVDYEHIDPLFCDAKEHDPEKIALLCSHHHDLVTRKVLPKRVVKEAKSKPFCRTNKFSHSHYYPSIDEVKLKVGSSIFEDTLIVLSLYGKPLIWIEKENKESPIQFNAIFYDSTGTKVGFLNKNTFYGLVTKADIKGISNRIEIKFQRATNDLILKIEADGIVEILRMNSNYLDTNIKVDQNGTLKIKQGESSFSLGQISTKNCGTAIELGGIVSRPSRLNFIFAELLKVKVPKVIDIKNEIKGYMYNNMIFNNKNFIVGYIYKNQVLNVLGEEIGVLDKYDDNHFYIKSIGEEAVDKEPIYITPYNKVLNRFLSDKIYDLSYRLFN